MKKYFLLYFLALSACSGGSSVEYICPANSGAQKPHTLNSSSYPVEKQIFGFALDAPLPYPECQKYEYSGRVEYAFNKNICYERLELDAGKRSCVSPQNAVVSLVYPYDSVPDVVSGKRISVVLSEGRVSGVQIPTAGSSSVSLVLKQLLNKYGRPVLYKSEPVYNALGQEFSSAKATWKISGYNIIYLGTVRNINSGHIIIMSPRGKIVYDKHMDELLNIGQNNIGM